MKETRKNNGRNYLMKKIVCVTAMSVGAVLFLAGCCSIVHGTTQKVGVSSSPTGAKVTVDKRPMGSTPVALSLERDEIHNITIEMEGYQPYQIVLTKTVSGWVWGNIVFGGLIGLVVDGVDGAIYNLTPESVSATLLKAEGDLQVQMIKTVPPGAKKIGQMERTPADQLKELKDLKDRGILTDEEYESKRAPLVNQLTPVQEDAERRTSVPEVVNPPPASKITESSSDDPFAKYNKALEQVDKQSGSR